MACHYIRKYPCHFCYRANKFWLFYDYKNFALLKNN